VNRQLGRKPNHCSFQVSIIEVDDIAILIAGCLLKYNFFYPVSKMMILKIRVEDRVSKSELCHPVYCVSFCSVEGKYNAFPMD